MLKMETEIIQVILNSGKIISHLLKQADEQLNVHVSLNHVICQLYDNLKPLCYICPLPSYFRI